MDMSVVLSVFRHSVLETGSVSIIRFEGGEGAAHLGPIDKLVTFIGP